MAMSELARLVRHTTFTYSFLFYDFEHPHVELGFAIEMLRSAFPNIEFMMFCAFRPPFKAFPFRLINYSVKQHTIIEDVNAVCPITDHVANYSCGVVNELASYPHAVESMPARYFGLLQGQGQDHMRFRDIALQIKTPGAVNDESEQYMLNYSNMLFLGTDGAYINYELFKMSDSRDINFEYSAQC
ncbi:hypothetical protein COEREDRAFT_83938 [Coemansia reversa NRRL 1564]|uniref:Uncharacterized protein n=1 Tax=Coemansia reversa (strain ATCC 12441 / NRRL 1564) TaxID=763665 RepID=A0A2G5B153_COERN|nr:hypothetical protein COEREDRAFT_83938 [Coemansia reversa NRRL 1564]|eukprot:PIA12743.1 hypothetical protein COEREDRAFT_83938 [Coemansia reversa NRRL 1564]